MDAGLSDLLLWLRAEAWGESPFPPGDNAVALPAEFVTRSSLPADSFLWEGRTCDKTSLVGGLESCIRFASLL